ncbi:MAG: hypothetical protein VW576_09145 [Opitutae bacterium]
MANLKNKAVLLFILLFSGGCNPSADDPINIDPNPNPVEKTAIMSLEKPSDNELFQQDMNKSYSSINRPWVLAKPLADGIDKNISGSFHE